MKKIPFLHINTMIDIISVEIRHIHTQVLHTQAFNQTTPNIVDEMSIHLGPSQAFSLIDTIVLYQHQLERIHFGTYT